MPVTGGVTIGALFPVIGWIWDMLDVDIPWWHSAYLSMGVGVVIALYQCCVWTREGYLKGRE